MNIKKQDKFLKVMEPKLFCDIVTILSIVFAFLGYDLGYFMFTNINGTIALICLTQYSCWVIWAIVVGIVRRSYIKKGKYVPIDEVFFDNELF